MNYIFLLYTAESDHPDPGSPESLEMIGRYTEFTNETREKNLLVAGEPLEGVATASSVKVRDGQTMVTDGPYAETKEQLGGFYILDCKDLDEALEYAAKIPAAHSGTVEVRPIMELPGAGE